jgi:hypothetical protein
MKRKETEMAATYEKDVVAWANEQARMIRAGRFDLLDIENIAEEIEDVGKSEKRELANRMAVLLAHLLKWQIQPERRGASWESTINEQRERITKRIERTPSLKSCLDDNEWWSDAWIDGKQNAQKETGLEIKMSKECPWTKDEILNEGWKPE